MALTCVVIDKNGKELSDDEIKNKVITNKNYYDIVLPIRERINKGLQRQEISV